MNKHIENIVIGKPIIDELFLLSYDIDDWNNNECTKTVWNTERYLPKLLVKYGFTKSTSELRRNRKDLCMTLDKPDFLEIKLGKRKIWIVIGE